MYEERIILSEDSFELLTKKTTIFWNSQKLIVFFFAIDFIQFAYTYTNVKTQYVETIKFDEINIDGGLNRRVYVDSVIISHFEICFIGYALFQIK